MPATTLKLPPELKDRVKAVTDGTGKSPHAFMVEAIEQQTALAEKRKDFIAAALKAKRNFSNSGRAYAFEDVRDYVLARAAGKPARKPRLKRWRG
jgi:predicted transcriptional regulator